MMTRRPSLRFLAVALVVPLLLVSARLLQAQQTQRGTISGLVRAAATQRPIGGVVVAIVGTNIAALTNAEGRYLINNVRPGEVRVSAEILGYRVTTQTARVEAAGTAT